MNNERTVMLYGGGESNVGGPVEYGPNAESMKIQLESSNNVDTQFKTPSLSDPYLPLLKPISSTKKSIFIYHSHNRESWLPELKNVKDPDMAFDQQINITLLGERIAQSLLKMGVSAVHSDVDYPSYIRDFKYPKSYQYSKQTLIDAYKNYPNLKFLFDIHRDSQVRSKTTITINNIDYPQVYFIIGEKNPNWENNMQLAKKIHERLNDKYPGISKGIYNKNANGNGDYNQSLNPDISLIEIGGVENTLKESYRTADILTEVMADLFWEAEKVKAPIQQVK